MEIKSYCYYGSCTILKIRKPNDDDRIRYKSIDGYNFNAPKIDLKDKYILDIGHDFICTKEELLKLKDEIDRLHKNEIIYHNRLRAIPSRGKI